jgi:putative Holliday junction resolvase
VAYLGIDYGKKRTGLSIFHDDVRIVLPLPAIVSDDDDEKVAMIRDIVGKNNVSTIVIGNPLLADGTAGTAAVAVSRFIDKLARRLPDGISIHGVDEGLTSEQAEGDMGHRSPSRRRKMRRAGAIDSQATVIILQDFLRNSMGEIFF